MNRKQFKLSISFEADWKFFAILPAINLNFHSKTFEFEWLFFAVYVDRIKPTPPHLLDALYPPFIMIKKRRGGSSIGINKDYFFK